MEPFETIADENLTIDDTLEKSFEQHIGSRLTST